MNHTQDWETIILRKPVQIQKNKPASSSNKTNYQKKLESDELIIPKKINLNLKKAIQTARTSKKISQKEFASKLGVPVQTITQYENGKAIPNNAFISKMEKILNVKLPRVK